jgi:hypothetical protein
MTEPITTIEAAVAGLGALPMPAGSSVDSTEPRTSTPDRLNADGSTSFTLKRACNGCGHLLGDLGDRDVDAHGNLTDVRAECLNCRPVVEWERMGCRTWKLTERSYHRVAHEIDQLRPWVFTKGYWQTIDGELQVVGLRIGQYPDHVVARYGDWIIHHPNVGWVVYTAPTATGEEADR